MEYRSLYVCSDALDLIDANWRYSWWKISRTLKVTDFILSKPNQPVQQNKNKNKNNKKTANATVVDHRSVDDLLTFINGQKMEEERLGAKSKAQKRARQKQKKVSGTQSK